MRYTKERKQETRQRIITTGKRQPLVLVAAAVGEQRQGTRHLVIDFEAVAVGIGEIEAALADMVDRALDLDTLALEMGVGLAQRRVARHLEGDVDQPHFAALGAPRLGRGGVLRQVERVKPVAQRHKDAAVLGVLLGDAKPEDIAVKPL